MRDALYGSAAELVEVVFYVVVASALAVVGALAELAGSQNLSAGQTTLGLWETGIGLVLLYAGYSVAVEFVLPRLRESDAAV